MRGFRDRCLMMNVFVIMGIIARNFKLIALNVNILVKLVSVKNNIKIFVKLFSKKDNNECETCNSNMNREIFQGQYTK